MVVIYGCNTISLLANYQLLNESGASI